MHLRWIKYYILGYTKLTDQINREIRFNFVCHTHGRQIRLPWFGVSKLLTTNCDLENWRSRGLTKAKDQPLLNVSAGMEMSPIASIRLSCPPEVSLINLMSTNNEFKK